MDRYKNPYFWIGLISVMIAASGVDFEALTSWPLLWQGIESIFMNPVKLTAVVMAAVGVFANPNTPGLKD